MRRHEGTRHGMLLLVLAAVTCSPSSKDAAVWIDPVTGMEFIHLPPGQFTFEPSDGAGGVAADEDAHPIAITYGFELGRHEVTQHQWHLVMGTRPSAFVGDHRPVERVSWYEAAAFVDRLTALGSRGTFRLPTEAEWEYACRAGTTTPFSHGHQLTADVAHVAFESLPDASSLPREGAMEAEATALGLPGSRAVGSLRPNPWGLHDMHGNVWEWTADAHCGDVARAHVNPRPRCESPVKVIRGGSWYFGPDSARCGLRYTHRSEDRGFSLGLRVVHEPDGLRPIAH